MPLSSPLSRPATRAITETGGLPGPFAGAPAPRSGTTIRLESRGGAAGRRLGVTALALLLAATIALPLVALIFAAVGPATPGLWSHLVSTVMADYLVNSLALAVLVGLSCAVIGTGAAWLVTMQDFPLRRLFTWALVLPLAMPTYVLAYAYTDLLQFAGPVQTTLREVFGWSRADYWFPQIRSLEGATFVLACALYPYVYVSARAAFLQQSICALEVSRTLGHGPFDAFLRVALPLARPAVVAGTAFAVMETLADFGAVKYFEIATFTTGIYRAWYSDGSPAAAAQLSLALVGFVLLVIAFEHRSRGNRRFSQTSSKYRELRPHRLTGAAAIGAVLVCGLPVLFGFVLPAIGLTLMAAGARDPLALDRILTLSVNSVMLAGLAALVLVAIGIFGLLALRAGAPRAGGRSGLIRFALRAAAFGYALPGAVIAVGVLIAIGRIDLGLREAGLATGLVLGGTVLAVLYGYLVRFFAVAWTQLEAGMAKITPNLEAAARVLGHRPAEVMRRVHLPLMRASVLSAALLVFVDVMKELPLTMILRPFNLDTLAIEAFRMATTERLDDAAMPSLLIVAVGLVPVLMLCRQVARSRPGAEC